MDKDYIWQAEYGRRGHLRNVFKTLLKAQNADSLQCLALYVNNIPYNLEFFVVTSYDKPKAYDIEYMQQLFSDAGMIYRQDLTMDELMRQMGSRRFNSTTLLDENSVDIVMDNFFAFAEIETLEKLGYQMKPFGKEKEVFISHSSRDKEEVEKLLPYINGMNLPVWFDKYSIGVGESIVDKVQEGISNSYAVIFWITKNFLDSKWCQTEMKSFIKRLIEEDILIISILDTDITVNMLPLFIQDIKYVKREKDSTYESIVREILPAIKSRFDIR